MIFCALFFQYLKGNRGCNKKGHLCGMSFFIVAKPKFILRFLLQELLQPEQQLLLRLV